jgi:hypothetical protein
MACGVTASSGPLMLVSRGLEVYKRDEARIAKLKTAILAKI